MQQGGELAPGWPPVVWEHVHGEVAHGTGGLRTPEGNGQWAMAMGEAHTLSRAHPSEYGRNDGKRMHRNIVCMITSMFHRSYRSIPIDKVNENPPL